jgi:hypothetical protein
LGSFVEERATGWKFIERLKSLLSGRLICCLLHSLWLLIGGMHTIRAPLYTKYYLLSFSEKSIAVYTGKRKKK